MSSSHIVEVVPVNLEPHPNADSLSIVKVFNYTVIVKTDDWKGKVKGAYIPPDSIVPDKEEFAFLGSKKRIKAKRLRGVMSQGLLWPIDDNYRFGEDVAEVLGITHYEPPEPNVSTHGACYSEEEFCALGVPVYDIETWYRYDVFEKGEPVYITEKLHGSNGKFFYSSKDGRIFVGSRRQWKKEDKTNLWWKVFYENLWIEETCRKYPDFVFYGEVYGCVQDLKYDHKDGKVSIRFFDILDPNGNWVDAIEFYKQIGRWFGESETNPKMERVVPIIYHGPYNKEVVKPLISGPSQIANHLAEGIVIRPEKERWCRDIGRVNLKAVSPDYLERSK